MAAHLTESAAVAKPLCGAKNRPGAKNPTCRYTAGFRTTHPGAGRCYRHGGLQPGDGRLKSGRWSIVKHERVRELVEHFANPETGGDPLDIFPDIHMVRALCLDFIERYMEFTEGLLAWHADWQLRQRPLPEDLLISFERVVTEWEIAIAETAGDATDRQKDDVAAAREFIKILRGADDSPKPRAVLDISDAVRHLDTVSKMVEREEKKRSANAVSRPDLNRIMHEMWRAIEARVAADDTKAAIREDWLRIRL
jgi:hypothetical protein